MLKIATSGEMQSIDRRAIKDYGIPGAVLMENAGRGVFTALKEAVPKLESKKITLFCGKGNNGGDGFVIARYLFDLGSDVEVFLLGRRSALKESALLNAEAARQKGIPITEIDETCLDSADDSLHRSHIVVDAIFGTGLTQAVSGLHEKIITKINQTGKFIVAVDMPSGIGSDTGQIIGPHVKANLTLALGLMKRSHVLYPSAEAMGQIQIVDIGLPQAAVDAEPIRIHMAEEKDIQSLFSKRRANTHKGTYGHALVIAGSKGKGGAAALTALAALRIGCGLATLALPESCQKAFELYPLEVMTLPVPETPSGNMDVPAFDLLLKASREKSVVAVGPGISTSPETVELIAKLLPALKTPLVLDADALNCMQYHPDLLSNIGPKSVLTPHPKEISRLTGRDTSEIQRDRIGVVSAFAQKYSTCLVLKGARTLIGLPSGSIFINPTGNPGMATAGSGDVLTGIIAGLIAQGLQLKDAAIAGTYIHGLTGDIFAKKQSETSLIAGDLLRNLPEAIKRILP